MNRNLFNFFILGSIYSPVFIVVLFNYLVDPYQIYHRQFFYSESYFSNQDYQAAGVINTHEFESMIIGSSLTVNFDPEDMQNNIADTGKVVKLSRGGSTAEEQSHIANKAMSERTIKKVFWGLRYWNFSNYVNRNFPEYLFDKNDLNDFKYLTNIDTLSIGLNRILYGERDRNELDWKWGELKRHRELFDGRNVILTAFSSKGEVKLDFSWVVYEVMLENFNEYLLATIENNPSVQFYLILPPLSTLYFSILYHQDIEKFNALLLFRKSIVEKISEHVNAKLFAFDEMEFTDDFYEYEDTEHFSMHITNYITEAMGSGKHLRTIENHGEYEEKLLEDAAVYLPRHKKYIEDVLGVEILIVN